MRWLWRVLALPVVVCAMYLIAATLGGMIPGPVADVPDAPADRRIALVTGPIHTDILLPVDDATRAAFAFAARAGVPVAHPGAEWIGVGWGGRTFYTTVGTYRDVSARAVFVSVLGDASVLRIDALGAIPEVDPALRYLDVSQAQLDALVAAIVRDLASEVALDTAGFNATDAFYPARGRFQIWRTCNAWVGETLRAAGISAGIWTPVTWALP